MIYNYKEGWWAQAKLSRSAGITSSYTAHPIFADDHVAYQHEVGTVYANASMPVVLPFAETFDLNLIGPRLVTVKQLIPDVEAVGIVDPASIANAISNLRYSLFYRNSRSLGTAEQQSPPRPVRDDGYVDFRTTGRDIRLRIDVGPIIQPFTLGAASHRRRAEGRSLMAAAHPPHASAAARSARDVGCQRHAVAISAHLQPVGRHGFADKISATAAAPGVMLQATDDPTKIFMLQVNAAGAISATPIALGGGKP